jgi:hypothetical protein
VVDLLEQHHQEGGRYEPTEFIEEGTRVAVAMTVSNPNWHGEAAHDVFKVFTFEGEHAVLLQDCADRADALAHLAAT